MGRLDRYTVQARLLPALIVALPIALAAVAVVGAPAWASVLGIATWAGGAALLAQIARDGGKRKEPALFESWGGMPTVARLRHRGPANAITLSRWHAKLKKAMKNAKLPTAQQEAADPAGADVAYEACSTFLRGHTRDSKKFPLVFAENCNYGFRRNLWGMRRVGVAVAVASLVIMLGLVAVDPSARRATQFARSSSASASTSCCSLAGCSSSSRPGCAFRPKRTRIASWRPARRYSSSKTAHDRARPLST